MKVNLNQICKVKLNDKGRQIYYHQYDIINKQCEKIVIKPHYPKEDKDGYYTTQLWRFMKLFGNYISMEFSPPCETEIIIE